MRQRVVLAVLAELALVAAPGLAAASSASSAARRELQRGKPTPLPTQAPTTAQPTQVPTRSPTIKPSKTAKPTAPRPTEQPTVPPTLQPTVQPTEQPTGQPTATTAQPSTVAPAPSTVTVAPVPSSSTLSPSSKPSKPAELGGGSVAPTPALTDPIATQDSSTVAYGVVGLFIAALLALAAYRSGARGRAEARVGSLVQGSPGPAPNRAPIHYVTTAYLSLPARVSKAQQATQEIVSKVRAMHSPGRYGNTGSGKGDAANETQRVEHQRELVSKVVPSPGGSSKGMAAEQQQQRVEQQRVGQQRVGQQPAHNAPRSAAAGDRTSSASSGSVSRTSPASPGRTSPASPGKAKARSPEPAPLPPAQDRSAGLETSPKTTRNPLFNVRLTHII
jgi:hypothetical protein